MSEPRHGKLVDPGVYRQRYDPLSGFERVCSLAHHRRSLEFLAEARPRHILEVGCGAMILARMAAAQGLDFESWTVVEPVADFAGAARLAMAGEPRFAVIQAYLEDAGPALLARGPGGFDAVVMDAILHETAEPGALLAAAMAQTAPGGQILASVPNANSFHRLLAVEAGLIPSPDTLSDRDRAFGHPVVFDSAGLLALMGRAGLQDLRLDGYLFKPFTNAQMETILADAPEALVEALIRFGRRFPDQAAEICVIGRKPR